ncbi:hypothetical protein [Nonomuraea dietziae]|uniref:hypothetical protein n=1 Tax=Nonomuraea dietziae TaxID=65515 RepID=UPI00341D84A0
MIAPSPDTWYSMFAIMVVIGAACILLGVVAGMTAAERHAEAETTVGEKLRVLIRLPKLRLVRDLHEAQEEALRLQRAAGELTGLNKTLQSELNSALDDAERGWASREAVDHKLAVEVTARVEDLRRIRDLEEQHAKLWTACLALTESWTKVAPQASVDMAKRELREVLDSHQPGQPAEAAA